MKSTSQHIRIAELIALELAGELSKKEKDELSEWLGSSHDNKELYNAIKVELWDNLGEQVDDISKNLVWRKIEKKLSQKSKRDYSVVLKYAALLVLALTISGIFFYDYFSQNRKITLNDIPDIEITPGSQRALLVNSEGVCIELDTLRDELIDENNGYLIKNNQRKLVYVESVVTKEIKSDYDRQPIYNTLITPRGGEYQLILSDGTKVWLNADSRLIYPVKFKNDIRELKLEGEAYFEVTKDENRPFVVKTAGCNVQVLGTSFNISAYKEDNRIVTTLIEGSVKLKDYDDLKSEMRIEPEEQSIFYKSESIVTKKKVVAQDFVAWKDGRFVFVKQDLNDILSILSRWYNFQFEFNDLESKELLFTGDLDRYEQFSTALDMISRTNKINFLIEGEKVYVMSKK